MAKLQHEHKMRVNRMEKQAALAEVLKTSTAFAWKYVISVF